MVKHTTVTLNAIALTSLLSTSINAYKPTDETDLKAKVVSWCNDPIATEGSVGAPINDWDVSDITNMDSLFENEEPCQPHIPDWDVSSVISMKRMFFNAQKFNSPLQDWDVSNVKNMEQTFAQAEKFNQYIGSWDLKSVTTTKQMFWLAESFNQNLMDWDVSNIARMDDMFLNAYKFDQRLDRWNMAKVLPLTGPGSSGNEPCSLASQMFYQAGPKPGNGKCNINLLSTWRLWVKEFGDAGCSLFNIFGSDCNDEDGDVYGTMPSDDDHCIKSKTKKMGNKEWKNEWKNNYKKKLHNRMKVKEEKNAKKNKSS